MTQRIKISFEDTQSGDVTEGSIEQEDILFADDIIEWMYHFFKSAKFDAVSVRIHSEYGNSDYAKLTKRMGIDKTERCIDNQEEDI